MSDEQSRPGLPSKPASALPAYFLNGEASVRMPSRGRERESLNTSIRKSFDRKLVFEQAPTTDSTTVDMPANRGPAGEVASSTTASAVKSVTGKLRDSVIDESGSRRNVSEPPRDPRDQASPRYSPILKSRQESPYTKNPPIDFDGLSWPCP